MKFRLIALCLMLALALSSLVAQTKSDSKVKATDSKKAACCTKDAKGPNATTAMKANCDPSSCTKMTAKGGPKMDCCKDMAKSGGKMDCCKDKAKDATKTDAKDKTKDAK
jgi:hypothetical protein